MNINGRNPHTKMKKTLFYLAGLVIMMSTISCSFEAKVITEGRELYKLYFKKTLKDPESLKIYDEKYNNSGYYVTWTIDYGAKNSLGGMVRETIEIKTYEEKVVVDGHEYLVKDLKK